METILFLTVMAAIWYLILLRPMQIKHKTELEKKKALEILE